MFDMGITGPEALYSEWALVFVCLIFVSVRLYIRLYLQMVRTKSALASDIMVAVAWVFQVIGAACDTEAFRMGLWRDDLTYTSNLLEQIPNGPVLRKILKVVYASVIPYYSGLWAVKVAFVLFYYSLIPREMKRLRKALNITTYFVVLSYLLVVFSNLLWCLPIQRNWSLSKTHVCFAYSQPGPYLISLGCHIISDLMIYALPFPLIPSLRRRLTRSQIVGVFGVFGLGLVCVGSTVIRVVAIGAGRNISTVGLWTSIETAMGVIVVCCPMLRTTVAKSCSFHAWIPSFRHGRHHAGSSEDPDQAPEYYPGVDDRRVSTPEKAYFDSFATDYSSTVMNTVSSGGFYPGSPRHDDVRMSVQQERRGSDRSIDRAVHRATLLSSGAMETTTVVSGSTVIFAPVSVRAGTGDDFSSIYGISPPDRPLSPERSIHQLTNAAVRVAQKRQMSRTQSMAGSLRSSSGSAIRFS